MGKTDPGGGGCHLNKCPAGLDVDRHRSFLVPYYRSYLPPKRTTLPGGSSLLTHCIGLCRVYSTTQTRLQQAHTFQKERRRESDQSSLCRKSRLAPASTNALALSRWSSWNPTSGVPVLLVDR